MSKRLKGLQCGLSLVEMMIAITLGLLILAGLTTILVNNSRARNEIERANRQIENGRYALQMLADDLRLAGYLAEFNPHPLADPLALPDSCATALADLVNNLPLHVQGVDNVTSTTPLSCLSDVKTGTDILIIRRASTCVPGVAGCAAVIANAPYFQASQCSAELNLAPVGATAANARNAHFKLETDTSILTTTATALHKGDCTTTNTIANIHQYRTHIYFVANNDRDGDNIPTLKRWELGATDPVPLVEGIENFQVEYGIDNATSIVGFTFDGVPDVFTSAPSSITAWRQVVSARIFLLARNTEITNGFTDTKTYSMDSVGNQTDPCSGFSGTQLTTCRSYKRHAYQSVVRLNNPAGRRTP
ncbi:MAG: PilW family protein [Gallionellaceae bacterium]|nr:PilW family protein [Gallionellaceae bacterium]